MVWYEIDVSFIIKNQCRSTFFSLVDVFFQIDWSHAALLCASSLTTASLTSSVLSTVVICVVLISRRFSINPDNIATPIAASLGDLTTLGALSLLGNRLIPIKETLSCVFHDINRHLHAFCF